ncbi:MAG: sulfatase [Rikenellaceae bacterium]
MKLTYNPRFAALLLSTIAIGTNASAKSNDDQKSPNFLFICIDDLRTEIGAYGCDYMKTPNLDGLASESRLFREQYVQVPTSGASRCCMLTGKYPTQSKDANNEIFGKSLIGTKEGEIPETFIHHLKRNGYYTVGMGKVSHHGNGATRYGGNESRELPHSWDRFVNDPTWLWKGDDILHAYANGVGGSVKDPKPAFEVLDVPDESYPDGRLANLATTELELIASRTSGEPFFMAVGFYKPHLPFCAPKRYWDMYSDEEVNLAPSKTVPEGVDGAFIFGSNEFKQQYSHPHQAGAGIVLPDDYARDLRHAYYAAISYTDTQVGKVLDKVKELGLDENTVIVVWGDHGWCLGDHTIWGKHNLFNRALNSTFMIKTPNMKSPGVATDRLMGTIDIYPTICELAGITPPEGVDGVSITPIIDNPKAKTRDEIYSYWQGKLSIKTDRYRLSVHNSRGKEAIMLFDHKNDPNETVNVAEKYPKVTAELLTKLKEQNKGYLPDFK